jgi:hypothetical protein
VEEVGAACSREFTAAHTSGKRPVSAIKWVVLHCTESSTARGSAAWFANPKSEGSAHLVVDDDHCYRCLSNDQIPWAAPGANVHGFHIEQAGYARWPRTRWLSHDTMLRRAAFKAALHCKAFGIPLRWVGPVGLRLGRKGVTTHADCTKAFGGSHTDPGAGYPKDKFMSYAKAYYAGL